MSKSRANFEVHCESIRKALWQSTSEMISDDRKIYSGVSLMVGAGMSKNAVVDPAFGTTPPSWREISHNLVELLAPGNEKQQKKLLETTGAVSGFLRLAQFFEAQFTRADLEDFIKHNVNNNALHPGELHKILVRMPWTDIFTTNWDTLLERAGKQDRFRNYFPILKADDFPGSRHPRIIKLHGTVGVTERCVFTEEDFRKYPTDHAPFVNAVRQSIMETIMVLVGFSGEDPNFLNWAGWVRDQLADFSPRIYLVDHFEDGVIYHELLHKLNVTPLDLGQITTEELEGQGIGDHGVQGRLEFWLRYLLHGEQPPLTVWPLESNRIRHVMQRDRNAGSHRLIHLTPDSEGEMPERVLSSLNAQNKPISDKIITDMIKEIRRLRSSYRDWVIIPADARDELGELLRAWSEAFSPNLTLSPDLPVSEDDCRVGKFIKLCISILSQPDPKKLAMAKFTAADGKGAVQNPPEQEKIDFLRRWVEGDLFPKIRELLCEFLWICEVSQDEWPVGIFEHLPQIMEWSASVQPEAAEPENDLPGLAPETEYWLTISYLYRALEQGTPSEKWHDVRNTVRRVGTRTGHKDQTGYHINIASMMYSRDRGARRQVLRRLQFYLGDRLPPDIVGINRLAAIFDEVACNRFDLDLARTMRLEAFQRTRQKIGSIITGFDAVSLEAWILALQHNGQHNFLTDAMLNEAGVTLNVQRSVDTRLDQLKALRCDPLREMRRAERNVSNRTVRSQSVRIFNSVGLPLIVQKRERQESMLAYNEMLDGFISKSCKAEFREFQDNAKQLALDGDSRKIREDKPRLVDELRKLDLHLVQGLRLLFRICSNPAYVPNEPALREILDYLADGAQCFFDVAPKNQTFDLTTVHFCLDAIDASIKTLVTGKPSGKSSGLDKRNEKTSDFDKSSSNVVQVALLVLGHLLLSRRIGKGRELIIDPILALKAVRVLSKVRVEDEGLNLIDSKLLPPSVSTDLRLVEALLRFAIAQSLRHHQKTEEVFRELAKSIAGNGNQANHTFVEPFRLLDVPPKDREKWKCPEIIDDALNQLADNDTRDPRKHANLIRIVDAMDDWNCEFSLEQRKKFELLVVKEFQKSTLGADLEKWEWMMIEVVRKDATREFLRWAFEEKHEIDASTEEGRLAAKTITRNLFWAICQRRTKLDLEARHVVALLRWIDQTIQAYQTHNQDKELRGSTHFRDIFFTVFGEMKKLEKLGKPEADLAMDILCKLHSMGVSIESVIPSFAEKFSQCPSEKQLRRLGGILRQGLATIHYEDRRAQFDATITATLKWVEASGIPQNAGSEKKEKPCMLLPPASLLGALGQALAIPVTWRGSRVLQAIHMILLHSPQDADHGQLAGDVLFDIQRRVDTLLKANRPRQKEKTNRPNEEEKNAREIVKRLEQILEALNNMPKSENFGTELRQLGDSIAELRSSY